MSQPEQIPNPTPQPAAPQAPPVAASVADPRLKSPIIAAGLSMMPGLGQVYVGYYQRGFVHAATVFVIITLLATGELGPLIPLAGLSLAFFWLYNMIDAARRATFYNQALTGTTDIELPKDFAAPGFRGSIGGGLALVALGAILLMDTRFDMSMVWLEEWWPAAIIGFGAYLVLRAAQERSKQSGDSYDD